MPEEGHILQNAEDIGLISPSVDRNKYPILEVLQTVLPSGGTILEIASGTGQHVVYFAKAFPRLDWQPSDPDMQSRLSIDRWISHEKAGNVRAALDLDVCALEWPVTSVDAIICINMIHISPWEATISLMEGAKRLLGIGGLLYLYGPYRQGGGHTAQSNAAFDADLRSRNASWGIRDLEAVEECAVKSGFQLTSVVQMPANNLSVLLHRADYRR